MTTYYRPSRDKHGYLFALILTPDAAKPTQSSENFGNSLSAGKGIADMKAYMEEYYGNDVEMASPARWQREIESRTFHSPEMLNNLEIVSSTNAATTRMLRSLSLWTVKPSNATN